MCYDNSTGITVTDTTNHFQLPLSLHTSCFDMLTYLSVPGSTRTTAAFKIHPNPLTGSIVIFVSEEFRNVKNITVYSMGGRRLINFTTAEENTKVLSPFPNGHYLVNVQYLDGTSATQKLVKLN
ncbi:MAG: T9SS type A sorting domain-containing protein [Sphingobacteriales bacterium]|nr:MAG: T9SS type A sorting domain-containing protein [Sphingobacteriales bacterium]